MLNVEIWGSHKKYFLKMENMRQEGVVTRRQAVGLVAVVQGQLHAVFAARPWPPASLLVYTVWRLFTDCTVLLQRPLKFVHIKGLAQFVAKLKLNNIILYF